MAIGYPCAPFSQITRCVGHGGYGGLQVVVSAIRTSAQYATGHRQTLCMRTMHLSEQGHNPYRLRRALCVKLALADEIEIGLHPIRSLHSRRSTLHHHQHRQRPDSTHAPKQGAMLIPQKDFLLPHPFDCHNACEVYLSPRGAGTRLYFC